MDNYIWHISHIYWSMFHCLHLVKMKDVNNSDLKDTGLASSTYLIKTSTQSPAPRLIECIRSSFYLSLSSPQNVEKV